ncbi:MAG: conjugal transfer protein TraX [Lachnospiraceae bacterium]|nr:conjugal transfer protein TraX [Lachnospiraceae bacterium]
MKLQKGLDSFQLKIIALIFMTIDHIAVFGLLSPFSDTVHTVFRSAGRIAAPIFLFILVQGLLHTRSKLKFIVRLYIAAAAVEALNVIFQLGFFAGYPFTPGNIFRTLMYTALYITCIEYIINAVKKNEYKKMILPLFGMILPFVAAWIFSLASQYADLYMQAPLIPLRGIDILTMLLCPIHTIEFSLLFVVLGVVWYFVNRKMLNCLILVLLSGISYLLNHTLFMDLPFSNVLSFNFYQLFVSVQWYMVLAVPFIAFYNEEKGRSLKYFFYIYYPLHQYVLFLLAIILFKT